MHPLLPADARISAGPEPACSLDNRHLPLAADAAVRLTTLRPRLNGRSSLDDIAESESDTALVWRLREAGLAFDLPVDDDGVPVTAFCDYLYARISGWRHGKQPAEWPWREVIAHGEAKTEYLQGILIENYHFVRAAAVRQSPLLSRATRPGVFDLVREFTVDEASHEHYFLETLTRWGIPARDVEDSVPLAATDQFIALQFRLAHLSVLDYLAGSAVLEVDPRVYARDGDPYQLWETAYGLGPEVLGPVREHIRDDVAGGHAHLFRAAASASGHGMFPGAAAIGLLRSARTVFEASRLWQQAMYEHYQVRGGGPAMAGL